MFGGHREAQSRSAQRHEVSTRQQIYAWRHEHEKKGFLVPDGGALFLPFEFRRMAFPRIAGHAHHKRPDGQSNCACATVASLALRQQHGPRLALTQLIRACGNA